MFFFFALTLIGLSVNQSMTRDERNLTVNNQQRYNCLNVLTPRECHLHSEKLWNVKLPMKLRFHIYQTIHMTILSLVAHFISNIP